MADEKATATSGATSVAEAVKRVADAAVAAVQKVEPVTEQPFLFVGAANGRFTIRGSGFSAGGVVRINGQQAETLEWGNTLIVGRVPGAVRAGKVTVEVAVDRQTVQKGTFTL